MRKHDDDIREIRYDNLEIPHCGIHIARRDFKTN